ncbi:MAG: NifU family protein [Bacteroidota bacterium]
MSQKYVTIYTEANPNPASMKFMLNFMLVPDGTDFDFPDAESAKASPLAEALFQFPFTERVFIMSNFITITRKADFDWHEISSELRSFIKEYLANNGPVLAEKTMRDYEISASAGSDETEMDKKIKNLLEEYVRPAVESDGGAINFRSFTEGVVRVELRGSCSGCPSSTITLKAGIENLLKRMIPEVKEVIAEGV